jgi:hypothetical protein
MGEGEAGERDSVAPLSSAPPLRHVLSRDESPVQRAALSALLGVIAIKDLLVYDVPGLLVADPAALRLPLARFAKPLAASSATAGLAFATHVAAFFAAMLLVSGRFARAAGAFLVLLYGYTLLSDELSYTNNGFLFIVLVALCVIEPLALAKPSAAYPRWAMRALVSVIYGVGVVVKLNPRWLSGYILGEALKHYHWVYAGNLGYDVPAAFTALAIMTVLVEGFLAVGLWLERTREKAAIVGVLFHASIELLLPVRMFSPLMMASYVLFLPPRRLDGFVRARERPVRLALAGAGAGLAIDLVFAWLVHAVEVSPRSFIALFFACAGFVALFALFPALGSASRGAGASFVPRAMRAPLVATLALAELFAVVKPALGFTNRFAWRMFTEVLRSRVVVSVLDGDGWRDVPADGPWSDDKGELAYRWDSLGEQRAQLTDYAEWLLSRTPHATSVRVQIIYERNGEAGEETIERTRASSGRGLAASAK